MRVLHIIDSLGLGGAQTLVKSYFEAQKENSDIFLFSLREKGSCVAINHKNIFVFTSRCKYSFTPLKKLREVIIKQRIDILHCHLFRSQVFGWLLKRIWFPEIKLIFHEHGQIFHGTLSYNIFIFLSKKLVNRFVAVSDAIKNSLNIVGQVSTKKIIRIYNFIDLASYNNNDLNFDRIRERQNFGIGPDEFVIGYVGRLSKEKGCEYLIKSLSYLGFKFKVLIAGDGPQRKKLIGLADKIGVKNDVLFLGRVKGVVKLYSIIDVLVVPSVHESFGLSALEAIAMRVAVIASDTEGLDEVVSDGKNGLFFKSKDSRDLSSKISLIRNGYKFEGSNGFEHDKFSLNRYVREIADLYSGL